MTENREAPVAGITFPSPFEGIILISYFILQLTQFVCVMMVCMALICVRVYDFDGAYNYYGLVHQVSRFIITNAIACVTCRILEHWI